MDPRRRVSLLLCFSLLAAALLQSRASPLNGELRCQCVELFTGRFPAKLITRLNLYPAGPHCANIEVIATTTDGREVCLDPEAPRIKAAIAKLLEKKKESNQL
uniref:alveolar macrophage chemotactic factor-like n=1 Tax=Euleptes europaea TaxID=460621 RepID=UPI00253FB079|nr:alveolar macrophage chemotactic factor-like [Euleptes europaea]